MNKYKVFKIALIASILLFLIYLGFLGLFTSVIGIKQYDYNKIFNKTVKYLNTTAYYIDVKKPGYAIRVDELYKLRDFYRERYNQLMNTPGTSYNELMVVETYKNLSDTTNILYNASLDLPSVWSAMKKSAARLRDMDIEGAVNIYNAIQYRLRLICSELNTSLKILLHTKYKQYTPLEHRRAVNYTINVVNKTLETLLEYMKLMNLINSNLDKLLNSTNNNTYVAISRLIKSRIDFEKLGPLANDIAGFVTKLASGYKGKAGVETPYSNKSGKGYSGGYSGSVSDD